LHADVEFRALEFRFGDAAFQRDQQQVQEILDHGKTDVRHTRSAGKSREPGELRIARQRGLHVVGHRDADFFKRGLQQAVGEQRDLGRGIGAELGGEQRSRRALRLRCVAAIANPVQSLAGARRDIALHGAERGTGIDATGHEARAEHERRCADEMTRAYHLSSSLRGESFLTKVIPYFGHLPGSGCCTSVCIVPM